MIYKSVSKGSSLIMGRSVYVFLEDNCFTLLYNLYITYIEAIRGHDIKEGTRYFSRSWFPCDLTACDELFVVISFKLSVLLR